MCVNLNTYFIKHELASRRILKDTLLRFKVYLHERLSESGRLMVSTTHNENPLKHSVRCARNNAHALLSMSLSRIMTQMLSFHLTKMFAKKIN